MLSAIHPSRVAKGAFGVADSAVGVAGTAVGLAEAAVRKTFHIAQLLLSDGHRPATVPGQRAAGHDADAPPRTSAATASDGAAAGLDGTDVGEEPEVVLAEPAPPAEPPVDVVGEALAAEAAAERGEGDYLDGMAHEPRGASRDEEHGDAALQRAEVDEIADEVAGELEDELGAPEPEVPDTTDDHLTEPVLDLGEANAVAAEMETLTEAADPDKG